MTSQTLSLLCCFRVYHCWIEVPSHFAKKMFILLSYLNVNLFRRAGSCRSTLHRVLVNGQERYSVRPHSHSHSHRYFS
ncbi:hypothetical protein ACB092_10G015900 [Castanea dentata]